MNPCSRFNDSPLWEHRNDVFRETDNATVSLMRSCALSTGHFFRADNAAELSRAFDAIGTGIGQLRLPQ